jgi:hypothetical protein
VGGWQVSSAGARLTIRGRIRKKYRDADGKLVERKKIPSWQFVEGIYYFFFSFGTTLLGGLLLGCHDFDSAA